VTPLDGLRGSPAVLLVTPSMAVATPAVFAAFDAAGGRGNGSVRMTSDHLAGELRNGLRAADLVARAGVLAPANDLLAAASTVVPGLVAFRRALFRVLGRPVGLSGSGPTLWALYASEADAAEGATRVEAAIASGALAPPGDGGALVVATTILAGVASPAAPPGSITEESSP
jgi:4-diphosphocytidyl-2C-methyl-D-erythritol kinase